MDTVAVATVAAQETWSVLGALMALGAMAQAWRASAGLPNWAVYPILAVCAVVAQLLWGADTDLKLFARHALEALLAALGTNRVVSDMAKGTPLETRRTPPPAPTKETE